MMAVSFTILSAVRFCNRRSRSERPINTKQFSFEIGRSTSRIESNRMAASAIKVFLDSVHSYIRPFVEGIIDENSGCGWWCHFYFVVVVNPYFPWGKGIGLLAQKSRIKFFHGLCRPRRQ